MYRPTEHEPRSRIGQQVIHADGRRTCRLKVPLGHAASQMTDQDGVVFEVENEREYEAGPGMTTLKWVDPATGQRHPAGRDLLPANEDSAARIAANILSAYLRKAARVFDKEVRAVPQQAPAETTGRGPKNTPNPAANEEGTTTPGARQGELPM